jgi:hypothetical protein
MPREIERIELWRCLECDSLAQEQGDPCGWGHTNSAHEVATIFLKADDVADELERLAERFDFQFKEGDPIADGGPDRPMTTQDARVARTVANHYCAPEIRELAANLLNELNGEKS